MPDAVDEAAFLGAYGWHFGGRDGAVSLADTFELIWWIEISGGEIEEMLLRC